MEKDRKDGAAVEPSPGIEARAAGTILQRPFPIAVGETTYMVPPPTLATLILASEAIAGLKAAAPDEKDVVRSAIAVAPEYRALGDILAVLILGAKEADRPVRDGGASTGRGPLGWLRRKRGKRVTKRERLAREVMEEMTPGEMYRAVARIIESMGLAGFFGLTTFLTGINLLRPTKVAAGTTEATASGH